MGSLVLCPPHPLLSRHAAVLSNINLSHSHPKKTHLDSKPCQLFLNGHSNALLHLMMWRSGQWVSFMSRLWTLFTAWTVHSWWESQLFSWKKLHTLKHYLIWKFVLVTALWRKWCSWRRFNASITQWYLSLLPCTISVRGNMTILCKARM